MRGRVVAICCAFALVSAAGCKTVRWLPESEVARLNPWEAAAPREVVTTDGGEVELSRGATVVIEREDGDPDEDDPREVARFERIDVTDLGLRAQRIAPAPGEIFIPAEELGRVGVEVTNWKKTIGLGVGLPLGVAVVLFIAAVIAASQCESCEDDDWDDWD